jgi:tol-pal system protein YbgF
MQPVKAYRIAKPLGQGVATGALLLCLAASAARAQSDDTLMLMNRLNDLDAQVQALKAGKGGNGMPQSFGAPVAGAGAADLDVRISQIQDQIQTLTGQVETQSNEIAQIRTENQRMTQDIQMRLNDLEAKVGGGAPAAAPLAPSDVQPSAMPKGAGTLGTLGSGSAGSAPTSTGSPEKDYETAYDLLAQSDYAAAEAGFKAFLQSYPKQALSGNADYWLGETYFARGMMDKAAATFADTYKKYPNGAKAPDALLRLGMALGQEGKASQACLAFAELNKQFPSASQKIKSTAAQERSRLKCQ